MKLIVGLGNKTDKYLKSRHNAGFIILDNFCSKNNFDFSLNKKLNSHIYKDGDTIYCKPYCYMNNSGSSVYKVAQYFDINYANIIIVHDDIDLKFGQVKLDFNKGSAGHNGIKDIIQKLGSKEFYRLRIGVGRPLDKTPIEDYVLRDFSKSELETINKINIDDYLSIS